ncbi:hypothetical protein Ocin01_17548 [Orchesella cincta]|uniref:Uncharacterized protein n=1 Tax=Orchesella cincta TaxID=48709 RepID=A0A1D2M8A3_ORCCI|nr:hypothetical protein Ocin01_17548 [Orchesella cincta]
MLIIKPAFFLLILGFSMYSPRVSSLTADTIFHRLTCHRGFKLANPFVLTRLEDAVVNCISRYPNPKSVSTYRDCVNFCIAKEIKMLTMTKLASLNLKLALNEWFGGGDGPWIVNIIADRFGNCVERHSNILLHQYQNCEANGNNKSNQSELWLCLQNQLPCEPKPEDIKKESNAPRTTMTKFDRGNNPIESSDDDD